MNYTILIADDEPEIRTLLRLYLENENYRLRMQNLRIKERNERLTLIVKKRRKEACPYDEKSPHHFKFPSQRGKF